MSLVTTLTTLIPRRASDNALAIGAVALATLVGAWIIQGLGYAACDLCYEERYAYYAASLSPRSLSRWRRRDRATP